MTISSHLILATVKSKSYCSYLQMGKLKLGKSSKEFVPVTKQHHTWWAAEGWGGVELTYETQSFLSTRFRFCSEDGT